jgi:hypothetical protein
MSDMGLRPGEMPARSIGGDVVFLDSARPIRPKERLREEHPGD